MIDNLTRGCALALGMLFAGGLVAEQAEAQLGLKVGMSHGNVSNTGVLPGDLGSRTGFAAGLALVTPPAALGVGLEALYAQRGAAEPNNTSSRELDYIDIPAYVRLMAPLEAVGPFVYVGPQISFEMDCRTIDDDCPDTGRPSTTYAGIAGAGVRFGTDRVGFTIEGRYVYGLTDLEFGTVSDEDSYEDRSFLILAGISF